jgi:hypothetical protein
MTSGASHGKVSTTKTVILVASENVLLNVQTALAVQMM